MLISSTVTKKVLETIVHQTFSTFGVCSSSSLLDSLKLLGFYYATNAGISINIEDLKTPESKKDFIKVANKEIDFASNQWQQGLISDVERFQSIIDSWNVATEGLKNRIVDYYQSFDPANNLYIMAFSGARGNMSQVRQLVGMRGLMADQNGNIIDIPIQRNFREGLSTIDYIVSSYGARKGIVDTALKTADSGYLTRRLIYLAQDLVIREKDCKSSTGIFLFFTPKSHSNNYIGRYLNWAKKEIIFSPKIDAQNVFIDSTLFAELKKNAPLTLNVRSSLTCQSAASICQFCYGFDLARNRMISLGETVGILAAQSIGEPGTQLTMRTFHTGGIFTGETVRQLLNPLSGKLVFPERLRTIPYRTNHGVLVSKLQQEATIKIVNWKGMEKEIFLSLGSLLYVTEPCFLPQNALLAEYSTESFSLGKKNMKPIYSRIGGEVKFTMGMKSIPKKNLRVNVDGGIFWVTSANYFSIPEYADIQFQKKLQKKKSFASLKIITPQNGYAHLSDESLTIFTPKKRVTLDLLGLMKSVKNCVVKIIPIVKNYHYVDSNTTVAFFYFQPQKDEEIYEIRRKKSPTDRYYQYCLPFFQQEKCGAKILQGLNHLLKLKKRLKRKMKNDVKKCQELKEIEFSFRDLKYAYQNTFKFTAKKEIIYETVGKDGVIKNFKLQTPSKNKQEKENWTSNKFFVIAQSDILKVYPDQIQPFSAAVAKRGFFTPKIPMNSSLKFSECYYFLKKDGIQTIFQRAQATRLRSNTIIKYRPGDGLYEKDLLAKLVNYTQQTEDIVQGLPKVEELIEARKTKIPSLLSKRAGVMIEEIFFQEFLKNYKLEIQSSENIFSYLMPEPEVSEEKKKELEESEEEVEEGEEEDFLKEDSEEFQKGEESEDDENENEDEDEEEEEKEQDEEDEDEEDFQEDYEDEEDDDEEEDEREGIGELVKKKKTRKSTKDKEEEKEKKKIPVFISGHLLPQEFLLFNKNPYKGKVLPLFPIFTPYEYPVDKPKFNKHGNLIIPKYRFCFKGFLSKTDQVIKDNTPKEEKGVQRTEEEKKEAKEFTEIYEFKTNVRFQKYLRVKGKKSDSKFKPFSWKRTDKRIFAYKNKKFSYLRNIVSSELLRTTYLDGTESSKRLYKNKKGDVMVTIQKNRFLFLEALPPFKEYSLSLQARKIIEEGDFIDIGEPITEGIVDTHSLLSILFEYHCALDGIMKGTKRSIQKLQLILVNSIQGIYQSQGVNIATKHIEIVVKQMTANVMIQAGGATPFLRGEIVSLVLITEISLALADAKKIVGEYYEYPYQLPNYEPKLLSATNSSLKKDGFLSAAGFQETKRVLSKAALEGSRDWLRGLKECVIVGRMIPAGSTFLNYKNYLDKAYSYSK